LANVSKVFRHASERGEELVITDNVVKIIKEYKEKLAGVKKSYSLLISVKIKCNLLTLRPCKNWRLRGKYRIIKERKFSSKSNKKKFSF